MAGKITANVLQLGDSATATQNFVLQTNDDGSAKLARGNAGATTQDILSIAANGLLTGAVNPTTGLRSTVLATMQKFADEFGGSLASNGYQKLPSGLIIQWAKNTATSSNPTFSWPIAFPNACLAASIAQDANTSASVTWAAANTLTATQYKLFTSTGSMPCWIVVIGY